VKFLPFFLFTDARLFLFDFRIWKINSPFRVVRGCAFASLVAAMLLVLAGNASAQTNGTSPGASASTSMEKNRWRTISSTSIPAFPLCCRGPTTSPLQNPPFRIHLIFRPEPHRVKKP
jgi:hypothetical protein